MILSLKTVALVALATAVTAAPVKRATNEQIIACFTGLIFTGAWPNSCQNAIAEGNGIIKSIALNQLSMDFTGSNAWAPATSSNNVVATMLSIPGISLPISSVRQHIVLADGEKDLGTIEADWASSSVSGATLTTSLPSSPFNVYANAHSEFSTFVGALSSQASHPVTLKGTIDAKLNLGIFGQRALNGIAFNNKVVIDGLNNLDIGYKTVLDINLLSATQATMGSVLSIVNPSKLSLKLGDVSFNTAIASGHIGVSTIKGLTLVPGPNVVLSTTVLDTTLPATNDFLNGQLTQAQTLLLTGYAQSSANPALNGGLAALNSHTVVPIGLGAFSQAPHKDWSLKVLSTTGSSKKVEIKATFQSPYYGLPVKFVGAGDFAEASSGATLFNIDDSLNFEVSGTGSTTVTFTATLALSFTAANKPIYQQWVNAANANGKLPLEFPLWLPKVIVGNDGVTREVDWGVGFSGSIAVGPDFASILGFFP